MHVLRYALSKPKKDPECNDIYVYNATLGPLDTTICNSATPWRPRVPFRVGAAQMPHAQSPVYHANPPPPMTSPPMPYLERLYVIRDSRLDRLIHKERRRH